MKGGQQQDSEPRREVPVERKDKVVQMSMKEYVYSVIAPLLSAWSPKGPFFSFHWDSFTLIWFSSASFYFTHICYANKGFLFIGVSLKIHSGFYLEH